MARAKKYFLFTYLILGVFTFSFSQFYRYESFGFNVGANIAVGNKFQRIGLTLNAYYFYDFIQVNAGLRMYRSLKNLGPNKEYNELVASGGVVVAYGDKQKYFNPFVSVYSNQTKRKYSVAYAYNAYFNKVKTTQQTGIVAFQFDRISIIGENDILARQILDRFRTGAFLIQYQYKNLFQAAINCTMWTGQMGHQVKNDAQFPYIGYMDTTGGTYTNISHGLLSAQLKFNFGHAQNIQANFGVDAEQVRNAVQNRLIHDMVFIPRKWFTPINCHIPMIDSKGQQFLFRSGQSVRKPEFFWNFQSNAPAFY